MKISQSTAFNGIFKLNTGFPENTTINAKEQAFTLNAGRGGSDLRDHDAITELLAFADLKTACKEELVKTKYRLT